MELIEMAFRPRRRRWGRPEHVAAELGGDDDAVASEVVAPSPRR